MQSRCGPPKFEFDQQDWSQFDFSRWNLDGITRDAASTAFAGLSQQLFNSEEWRQHFQTELPALEREALNFFKGHSQQLRDQKDTAAEDFDKRIAAAQKRSEDFQKFAESVAAPPVVQAGPKTFHLGVRVTAEDDVRLGLPSLVVQITDPQNEKLTPVQAMTDRDGNAVLTVPEELVEEFEKTDTTLEVLSPAGQTLVKLPSAVCVRLNQVETKVVTLQDSPEVDPYKSAAMAIRLEREGRIRNLAVRMEALKGEREAQLRDLDCRLEDNEAIIAELEPKGGTPESPEATTF